MKQLTRLPRLIRFSALFLLIIILSAGWVFAVPHTQTKRQVTPLQDHRAGAMPASLSAAAKAGQWGLSEAEWHRYETIMAGPRGIWSPGIDPISALGISTDDPAQRRYYAELLLTREKARVEAERDFIRTLDTVRKEQYPHQDYLDRDKLRALIAQRVAKQRVSADFEPGDRVKLFVLLNNCPQCVFQARYWLERIQENITIALDIYALDAPDDAALRRWAGILNLSVDLVRSKRITLNHDHGTLRRVSGDFTLSLRAPVVMRQRGADLVMLASS